MEDAEHMILMFPTNKKSYYRKAEILNKLKKFKEAEEYFRQVLNLDPLCEDARAQAIEAQVSQICKDLKFSRKQGLQALNYTGNVEDARKALITGSLEARLKELEDIIYVSDDEDGPTVILNSLKEYDPLQDPSNPYHSVSLWVGCISKGVSESFLTNLFSKYGRVKSVRIMSDSDKPLGYAFINFHDSDGPGKAMKNLQGAMVEGQKLYIKYPDNVKIAAATRNSRFK
ncbi:embryonic polyadenylate-binding protein B isoform X2 [Anabrus simplex]